MAPTPVGSLAQFLRDLDKEKGRLPRCQEVTEIQESVEKVLMALLMEVEKENAFFKTTLINSGSFYEGTKVWLPNEFDYLIQLDTLAEPGALVFEELPCATVIACPTAVLSDESPFGAFEWKRSIKTPFVKILNEKAKGFEAFGMKVLAEEESCPVTRHGPAYIIQLEWNGGRLFKQLKISVDLSLAVKICCPSSTMSLGLDLDIPSGTVMRSIADRVPYYFALGSYRNPLVEDQPEFFEKLNQHCDSSLCLRISQSCLEQEIFHYFGPDGGPTVCLRLLKVLRDVVLPKVTRTCTIDITLDFTRNKFDFEYWALGSEKGTNKILSDSAAIVSSYVLKTLVLLEWQKYPEEFQWTGNGLERRLVNILKQLCNGLRENKLRSFFYSDYNIIPQDKPNFPATRKFETAIVAISELINRLTSIHDSMNEYKYEDCFSVVKKGVEIVRRKITLIGFIERGLRSCCEEDTKVKELVEEMCEIEQEEFRVIGRMKYNSGLYLLSQQLATRRHRVHILRLYTLFKLEHIYGDALFRKALFVHAVTGSRTKKIKSMNRRELLFEEIAYSRMEQLDVLLNSNSWLWLQEHWAVDNSVCLAKNKKVVFTNEKCLQLVLIVFWCMRQDLERLLAFLVNVDVGEPRKTYHETVSKVNAFQLPFHRLREFLEELSKKEIR